MVSLPCDGVIIETVVEVWVNEQPRAETRQADCRTHTIRKVERLLRPSDSSTVDQSTDSKIRSCPCPTKGPRINKGWSRHNFTSACTSTRFSRSRVSPSV